MNRRQIYSEMYNICRDDRNNNAYNGEIANAFGINQVNFTRLAEQFIWNNPDKFDDSVLDDETHEIWDIAIEAGSDFEKFNNQ